ncbi:MAG: hypothetical protein Q7T19_12035 [Caulobacter sp.]|nr:hypothetical protein [Caulobacter sp.]
MRPTLLALAAVLSLALPRAALAETPPLTGAALAEACRDAKGDAYRLFVTPEITRQGAELKVQAVGIGPNNPWGGPLPLACLKHWKLSVPAAATLSADHSRLIIADKAVPGTQVRLTAEFDGKTAAVDFTVVAREAVVLTGYWSEVGDADCPAGEPLLRELHFIDGGKFEVTWMPFERYIDYWGDYSFDPATGAIVLKPTGGNHVPADADLDGKASTGDDGLLHFSGFFFGSPRGGPKTPRTCAAFKPH